MTKKAEGTGTSPVLPVAIPLLATVLDLPAGVTVTSATVEGGAVMLTLDGVDWADVRGWKPRRGASTPERITAEYSVDTKGRRSLNCLALPDDDSGGIVETDPTEEKE